MKTLPLLITIVCAISIALLANELLVKNASQDSYAELADRIVQKCASSDYTPSCYDEEIPKLMDEGLSMEDAFEVTKLVQELDKTYQYCHVLGHYLSAKETAKDPSKWKDVIARAPIGICSNGAVHGAFQERFRKESLEGTMTEDIVEELDGICESREGWNPPRIGNATCLHALGHLAMYVTGGNIDQSLELCKQLIAPDEHDMARQLCYDGTFMQLFQPLEPEDKALILGQEIETKEQSVEFCSKYSGEQRGSCMSERWPLFVEEMNDPARIDRICIDSEGDLVQHERCLNGVFYVATSQANLDLNWIFEFCPNVNESYRGQCFANAASRLIEVDSRNIDRAVSVCEYAQTVGEGDTCNAELLKYSSYTFIVGSDEFYHLCNRLSEPYRGLCLAQDR